MRIQRLAWSAVAALVCVPALAHDTAVPHAHPHGAETVIFALIAAAAAFGLWKSGVVSAIRNKDH